MGPGFFLFFQHETVEQVYDPGAGSGNSRDEDFWGVIGPETFMQYMEKMRQMDQPIEVESIEPRADEKAEGIKQDVIEKQIALWPEAVSFIAEAEKVSEQVAKELFMQRAYIELEQIIEQDDEEMALLLILMEE